MAQHIGVKIESEEEEEEEGGPSKEEGPEGQEGCNYKNQVGRSNMGLDQVGYGPVL